MKRLILLVALAVLIYTLTVTYSAPSITYDNTQYLSYIIRYYSSNNSYSSNLASLSSFQLFSNNAQVGDMIYFGFGSRTAGIPALSWHDLYFSISTPLQGTGIQLVWEYWDGSARAWRTIPGLVDETNKFTQSGWVKFPVPPYWFYGAYFDGPPVNGIYSVWIRVRLAGGTVTNGGAVDQRVVCHDNTITVRDYPSVGFIDIYQASVSNNWGVVTKQTGSIAYLISAHLLFVNSTLYSSKEFIQIGYYDRPASLRSDPNSKLVFGRLTANGVGVDGSEIYIFAKMTYIYITVNNIYLYGSRYVRYGGDFTHNFGGNIDIVDSQIVGDMSVYILPDTNTRLLRVLYSSPVVFRLYSKNATVSYLFLPAYTTGIMVGTNARPVLANVVFLPNQTLTRYGNANATLLDCVISPSQIASIYPFGSDVWIKFLYSFNIKLIDKDGNPVSGATVKLYDKYGSLVFSVTTNSTGQIPTQYVMTYITWWNKSESWSIRHEKNYNPFTLVVSHPNYPPVIMKWNIEQKVDLLLPIDPLDPAELYVNTTRNLYLPKDVVIINAYVLYENVKQTGLTINVTVFKPDGSKSPLIQLRDDGQFPDAVANDGLYSGLFLDTSKTGLYLVNASTIFQSAILRANWTFLVDNTADLVLKVNASLSSRLSMVNSTLHSRIDKVNSSLSAQVVSVNNTVKTCCSEVKDLVRAVNSSLYNKIVSVNGSIYGKLVSVNASLYAEIVAVNSSIHMRLSNINVNTTTLENLIKSVNQTLVQINGTLYLKLDRVNTTLYNKLDRVNTTLYGKLVQINDTLYLKVDGLALELANVNASLYNAIRSVNSTLYVKLLEVNQSLYLKISNIVFDTSLLENMVRSVNATLHGRLTSINNTLYLKVDTVQLKLLQVNNTLYGAVIKSNGSIHLRLDTIDARTSNILARLGEVNASIHGRIIAVGDKLYLKIDGVETQVSSQSTKLDQVPSTIQQVPSKIDKSTSTILDEIQKLRNDIAMLRQQLEKMQQVTIPPWVYLLVIPALILGLGILVALRRLQPPSYGFPSETPKRFKAMRVVYGVLVILGSYLLLLRYGNTLPVPFEVTLALIVVGVIVAIIFNTRHGLAVMLLLGLIYYLYQSTHVSISPPEIQLPIPFPVLSLVIVFLIFTVIYVILRRRKQQQEVMMW